MVRRLGAIGLLPSLQRRIAGDRRKAHPDLQLPVLCCSDCSCPESAPFHDQVILGNSDSDHVLDQFQIIRVTFCHMAIHLFSLQFLPVYRADMDPAVVLLPGAVTAMSSTIIRLMSSTLLEG
jgi:hypothetical protein